MRSRRTLVLVVLIVLGVALVLGVLLMRGGQGPGTATPVPTETPQSVKILVAANNLPRGLVLAPEHVMAQDWPIDRLPPLYYTDPNEVVGKIARTDIPQGMPLMPTMVVPTMEEAGATGSLAALQIPEGRRAIAIPVDLLGGVAWAIQPGDHVDVLASWFVRDIDPEFQSVLPNQWAALQCAEGQLCQGIYGRVELLPNGQVIMVYPSPGNVQGRYMAQVTVQDAVVLGVGTYQMPPAVAAATPTPSPTPPAPGGTGGQPAAGAPPAAPTPTPIPPIAQAVILIVDPQEALVLKGLVEMKADITLVLRRPGDTARIATDTVSQEYIIARYNFAIPPKLPYALSAPEVSPVETQIGSLAVPPR